MSGTEVELVEVAAGDAAVLPALANLLVDSVEGGASVGFLAPLTADEATGFWQPVVAEIGPDLRLWVARAGGVTIGTVTLARCPKSNGRHRAEVRKLLVLRHFRGLGLGRLLMEHVESVAREMGLTLLHLDTETDSAADRLYESMHWTRLGVMPAYAGTPEGVLRDCTFWWKQLGP